MAASNTGPKGPGKRTPKKFPPDFTCRALVAKRVEGVLYVYPPRVRHTAVPPRICGHEFVPREDGVVDRCGKCRSPYGTFELISPKCERRLAGQKKGARKPRAGRRKRPR